MIVTQRKSLCQRLLCCAFRGPVGLRPFLLGSKLNVLFVICAPLAFAAEINHWSEAPTFILAMLAIIPLAERLGYLTEQLTLHTNDTLGGMLNATFGNAVETLMSVVALVKAKDALVNDKPEDVAFFLNLVQTSLLGSMLSNLLLVQGSAFFIGGLRHPMQSFSREGAVTSTGLLVMATLALSVPTMMWSMQTVSTPTQGELAFSRFVSFVLLIIYLCFCLFQLGTHRFLFEKGNIVHKATKLVDDSLPKGAVVTPELAPQQEDAGIELTPPQPLALTSAPANTAFDEDVESSPPTIVTDGEEAPVPLHCEETEEPEIGLVFSVVYLVISTVAVSFVSHVVVEAAQGAVTSLNLDAMFVGGVILPIVGNAAEHASALMFAWKDKMDTSIAIAVGSAIQIPLFVLPVCVLCAWALEVPLSLNINRFLMSAVVLTSLAVSFTLHAGASHWLHGLILIFEYVIIAAAFWFHD
ncbi:calcium/proton exchanger [Batrachochytrium salamandrivorans]|nr:calcium/proton exchanger [Batrachochytrium salamandrivorans]